MAQDQRQAPDASDSFEDQVDNVPVENIRAPIETTPSTPDIPEKDRKIAQKVKDDLASEEEDKDKKSK